MDDSDILPLLRDSAAQATRISTRLPATGQNRADAIANHDLSIGLDEARLPQAAKAYAKNSSILRGYGNVMQHVAENGTDDEVNEHLINHIKDNLLWLHDQVPEELRPRSSKWYDGANAIAHRFAQRYGLPVQSVAGVLAALSPQKDWFQNVSLGERLLDVHHTKQDHPWTPEMDATGERLFGAKYQPELAAIRGKSYRELGDDTLLQALWARTHDEAHHDPGYRIISPEGDFTPEYATTGKGDRQKYAWGSLTEIGKALDAIKSGGDMRVLSPLMGEKHKVRNFFNNILDPMNPRGDVTIDTHAIAAGLLRPLGGSAPEVSHALDTSLEKKKQPPGYQAAAGNATTGVRGTYPIFAEAYRRAAKERGILPRQMQSITWEAVRGLFKPTFKRAANIAAVDAVWDNYRRGKISAGAARRAIHDLAKGIDPPSWVGHHAGADAPAEDSSYARQLYRRGVSGPSAEGLDGGARAHAAGAPAGPLPLPEEEEGLKRGGVPAYQPGGPIAHPAPHDPIIIGAIESEVPGRTDKHECSVPAGSYVIPADVVSALGQGNTIAGQTRLDQRFKQGQHGPADLHQHMAAGGPATTVPVVLAGGEYVVAPAAVARAGMGNLDRGHKALDAFVKATRKKTIHTLRNLPGPKK